MLAPWKKSYDKPRQHVKNQRHHFDNKGPNSQIYGFSSSHVWMWKLNHKVGWVQKNRCFRIIVLEKTWESIGQQGDKTSQSWKKSTLNIHWKDWSWNSNLLATWWEEPTFWKRPWCLERFRAGGEGATEDEMVDGVIDSTDMSLSKFQEIAKDRKSLRPWGHKELDMTERLNNNKMTSEKFVFIIRSKFEQSLSIKDKYQLNKKIVSLSPLLLYTSMFTWTLLLIRKALYQECLTLSV